MASRSMRPASLTSSWPLISSTPTLSRPTVGPVDAEHGARHAGAENGEIDELVRVGADGGADVQHHAFAAQCRPDRRDRRAVDGGHGAQAEFRHRHQRAGVAGGDAGIRRAGLDRLDRLPHRRLPAAMAQRLARLVVHPHRDLAVEEFADLGQLGKLGQFGAHQFLAPVDDEADVGAARRDRHERRNDHGWSVIAAHGIDGNPDHAVFISRFGGRSL